MGSFNSKANLVLSLISFPRVTCCSTFYWRLRIMLRVKCIKIDWFYWLTEWTIVWLIEHVAWSGKRAFQQRARELRKPLHLATSQRRQRHWCTQSTQNARRFQSSYTVQRRWRRRLRRIGWTQSSEDRQRIHSQWLCWSPNTKQQPWQWRRRVRRQVCSTQAKNRRRFCAQRLRRSLDRWPDRLTWVIYSVIVYYLQMKNIRINMCCLKCEFLHINWL